MKPEILFLITARAGSKGVPGKNLRKIQGLSLIAYKAIAAQRSNHCSRLVISSEDREIQQEGKAHGAEVLFTRPAELANDTARSDDVILHAIDYFEAVEKRTYDAIMLLEPASPFGRPSDFDAAVEIYLKTKAKLVVGLKETEVHSDYIGPLSPDGRAQKITDRIAKVDTVRRQNFETEYTLNGSLYLIDWNHMKDTNRIYSDPENTYGHVMDRFYSAEIDTPYDMRLAELFAGNGDIDVGLWK
jgi:CMP-N,N'-diacetyllegionaminic acid synthase